MLRSAPPLRRGALLIRGPCALQLWVPVLRSHSAPPTTIPALDALYSVGVTASVIHNVTLLDGAIKLFVSGIERAAIVRPVEEEFLLAEAAPVEETGGQTAEAAALFKAVLEAYQVWAKVDFSSLPEQSRARLFLPDIEDPGILADAIAPLLQVGIEQRQALLETRDVVTRLETILALLKAAQQAA